MDAAVPRTQSALDPGAQRGAIIGFALGVLLALAGVTTSVSTQTPDESGYPAFRVRVLGVIVYRHPEDGDFLGSKARPGGQWRDAQIIMAFASGVACCALGWALGFAFRRLARASPDRTLMFPPRTRNCPVWAHRRALVVISVRGSRCRGRCGQGMPNKRMHASGGSRVWAMGHLRPPPRDP